jgi:hypothetical protein
MSAWRQVARGVRALVRRGVVDREIAEEVEGFVEQATAEMMARGMTLEAPAP